MPNDSFQIVAVLPAPPVRVYAAWIDAAEHAAFTGQAATSEPRPGGEHTAGGGYISGRHVELVTGIRIVQTWRTTEFPRGAIDSRVELTFEPHGAKETRVTLVHTDLPPGQGDRYRKGWASQYFERLRAYLGGGKGEPARAGGAKGGKPSAAKRATPAKKAAARTTRPAAAKKMAKAAPRARTGTARTAPKKRRAEAPPPRAGRGGDRARSKASKKRHR